MGKQSGRRRSTAVVSGSQPKQTSGLNWVLKTGILIKQKQKGEVVKVPMVNTPPLTSCMKLRPSSGLTNTKRSTPVPRATGLPEIPKKGLRCSPRQSLLVSTEHGLSETCGVAVTTNKVQRNATFSIKKFPSGAVQRQARHSKDDQQYDVATGELDGLLTHGNSANNNATNFVDNSLEDTERELFAIRTKLQEITGKVNSLLEQCRQRKLKVTTSLRLK